MSSPMSVVPHSHYPAPNKGVRSGSDDLKTQIPSPPENATKDTATQANKNLLQRQITTDDSQPRRSLLRRILSFFFPCCKITQTNVKTPHNIASTSGISAIKLESAYHGLESLIDITPNLQNTINTEILKMIDDDKKNHQLTDEEIETNPKSLLKYPGSRIMKLTPERSLQILDNLLENEHTRSQVSRYHCIEAAILISTMSDDCRHQSQYDTTTILQKQEIIDYYNAKMSHTERQESVSCVQETEVVDYGILNDECCPYNISRIESNRINNALGQITAKQFSEHGFYMRGITVIHRKTKEKTQVGIIMVPSIRPADDSMRPDDDSRPKLRGDTLQNLITRDQAQVDNGNEEVLLETHFERLGRDSLLNYCISRSGYQHFLKRNSYMLMPTTTIATLAKPATPKIMHY